MNTNRSVFTTARTLTVVALTLVALTLTATESFAQIAVITAGANMDIDFNEEIDVPYSGFVGAYFLEVNLVHDPGAGPMFKHFQSPISDTGAPILLDAEQPFPQPVNEDFHLIPLPGGPANTPVSDWHEEILTEGWEWVLPGDERFPDLFPDGQSLITKNGEPHPWTIPPLPAVHEPNQLWVAFPAIGEGDTLDIHKALLWVGTEGNRIWGDNILDNGATFDESEIRVWEYPTIPEPGTLALAILAVICGSLGVRRRN